MKQIPMMLLCVGLVLLCAGSVSAECLTYHFCAGYNFISVPFTDLPDSTAPGLFGSFVTGVHSYQDGMLFDSLEQVLRPGYAYLLTSAIETVVTICGTPVCSYDDTLAEGWNWIGSVYGLLSFDLGYPDCIDATEVYTFDCAIGWVSSDEIPPGGGLMVLNTSGYCRLEASTVGAGWSLRVSPDSVSFAVVDMVTPSPQGIVINALGDCRGWGWTVTPLGTAPWLAFAPAAGNGSGPVTLQVDPTGYALGDYRTTLEVAAESLGRAETVLVEMHVAPCGDSIGVIHIPPAVTFNCCGAFHPDTIQLRFTVRNTSLVTMYNFRATLEVTSSDSIVIWGNPQTWGYLHAGQGSMLSWEVRLDRHGPLPVQYRLLVNWACGAETLDYSLPVTLTHSDLAVAAEADTPFIIDGESARLHAVVTPGIPPYTYSWAPATGLSSTTIARPTASPSVTTTYTVAVTDSNCCVATAEVTVEVGHAESLSMAIPTVGWSLLSIPGRVRPESLRISPPSALVGGALWRYGTGGYARANTGWIPLGEGFWGLFTAPCSLLTGYYPNTGDTITVNIPSAGWYILGNTLAGATVESLSTDPPGLFVAGQVHIYEPGTGYSTLTSGRIPPGRGYWALFGNACRLRIK